MKPTLNPARIFLPVCLLFFIQKTQAQFHLNGSAAVLNDTCWTLTTAQNFIAGSIWNVDKINLNNSFQVIMDLQFGCKDGDGADGILFGFQPLSTSVGQAGEGLGFQGVAPSLGIEFDTWQNGNLNDPSYDHIAISKNGNLNHGSTSNLAGPVQANATKANIEDCNWHKLRVDWDATAMKLEIWFDCDLRLTYTGDIVNEIFGGDPLVFWGFTASTGGSNNLQQVCFSYTTFLDGFEDVVICPGGQFQLKVSGGTKYHWTPATGLSNPNIPNPIAKPDETTTYLVEVSDPCNNPFYDSITVFIDGDTVFFDLGLDTSICEGQPLRLNATSFGTDTVTYQWSSGPKTPSLDVQQSGLYSVTVTIDNYCVADDRVAVTVIPLPKANSLGVDTVLCFEQILELDATAGGSFDYTWNDGLTLPTRTIETPGTYSVLISNECGEATASIDVGFEDCRQVYFPNAFSPNGDGINDVFLPFDGGDVGVVRFFRVYDRWGGLVFSSENFQPNSFDQGWNGLIRGKKASQGVYIWLAEVEFRDGKIDLLEGEVVLMK
jgi:gliding motility-associated-like protein